MRPRTPLLTLGVMTIALSSMAMNSPRIRSFPSYVLLRQEGLPAPALLTMKHVAGADGMLIDKVYAGLASANVMADSLAGLPFIEVAEFFGFANYPVDSLGNPVTADGRKLIPRFDSANHYSYIYLRGGNRKPIWENPIIHSNDQPGPYFEISDSALKILERIGLRMKPGGAPGRPAPR